MVVGRRFGSGFSTMCDGMPPCVTIVGDTDVGGKGTKVWRLLDVVRSQDGNFEEAWSPPIQWRVRKREEALPNNSNASEPEPDGDEKHDLERDPSEGMSP